MLSDADKRSRYDSSTALPVWTPTSTPMPVVLAAASAAISAALAALGIFSAISSEVAAPGALLRIPLAGARTSVSRLELTFEEAAFGTEKEVTVPRIENCPTCHGTG